jgi:hypothetical protein
MPIMNLEEDDKNIPVASTKVAAAARENEDTELLDMIAGFGADKGYEVRVYRTSPKKWEGISIEGHLDTFEEWQSENDLKSMYGGGTFQLKIHRPGKNGRMEYLKAVSVKLPGPPRGQGVDTKEEEAQVIYESPSSSEDSSILAQQAMSTMKELIDKKQEANGFDPTMMQMMMAPLQAQIAASNAALQEMQRVAAEKDARIMELIAQKPDTSEKDGLLNKMFDTESSRSEHLRAMHESEMRQLRENAKEDIKRSEERHRDELRSREDIQRREIDNMTRSNQTMMDTLKMSYESRIESYKKDIERLERDINDGRTELITLRAKKDKTFIEQASELQQVGDALKSLGIGGSGDDDEDKRPWYERMASQVIENPEAVGQFAGMITGNNPAAQQQAPQQAPQQQASQQPQQQLQQAPEGSIDIDSIPIGQPFYGPDGPDGETYVKVPPDGSVVTYEQALKIAEEAEAKQNQAVGKPSDDEVKTAIRFMEAAFTAGTDSATFANSAKAMIPQNILKYMETVGVDTFLNEVAVLEQGSPLRNQAGRTYMREVAKFLLEGIPG